MQASPAFHPVAARQYLQRPPIPPDPQAPKKLTWPPSVRQYVQRAFEAGNAVRGIEHSELQQKLKAVITSAAEQGYLHATDWSTFPLPQHLIMQEREQAALYGAQDAVLANINEPSRAPPGGMYDPEPVANGRKRKSPDTEWTQAEEQDNTPPWKKKAGKNGLEARITGKAKNQDKKQKKIDAMRAHAVEVDPEVLERRKQRFGYVTPEPSPYVSSRGDSTGPIGPLVGTCQKLEKSYFRLTAPPAPDTVRPLTVLEKALEHILKKWKKEHDYTYACDQLKSLRQDLTVQHVKNDFTVQVYESHARIALEMADLGEYNQCQTQLRALYRMNLGGKPEEFIAYRILYYIYTCNRTDLNDVLADLTPTDKQRPGVRHALQVRSALASGNYHRFFRLYDETPFMGGYVLDMFVHRERLAALAAICRA